MTFAAPLVPADSAEPTSCQFFFPPGKLLGRSLPLVVYLHGDGGNEAEIDLIMPCLEQSQFVGVGVRAPQPQSPSDLAFGWGDDDDAVEAAADRVCHLLDGVVADYEINRDAVFLMGCGRAGELALHVALLHPQRFAGTISVAGRFPAGAEPLAARGRGNGPPLLILNSLHSRRFPESAISAFVRFAHAAGLDATLRLYPGEEAITTSMLKDAGIWLAAIFQRQARPDQSLMPLTFEAAPVAGEEVVSLS